MIKKSGLRTSLLCCSGQKQQDVSQFATCQPVSNISSSLVQMSSKLLSFNAAPLVKGDAPAVVSVHWEAGLENPSTHLSTRFFWEGAGQPRRLVCACTILDSA